MNQLEFVRELMISMQVVMNSVILFLFGFQFQVVRSCCVSYIVCGLFFLKLSHEVLD